MTDNRATDTDPYQYTYDPLTDSVSEELIRAVAVLDDAAPTELAILADVIDPEALDALFQSRSDGVPRDTPGHVQFEYNDHHVQITTDGTITIDSAGPARDD